MERRTTWQMVGTLLLLPLSLQVFMYEIDHLTRVPGASVTLG